MKQNLGPNPCRRKGRSTLYQSALPPLFMERKCCLHDLRSLWKGKWNSWKDIVATKWNIVFIETTGLKLEVVFLQSPHSCSAVSPWNLFTCLRKTSVLLKVFPHSSHVSTLLLPVWTLRCLAKFAFLNIFPHSSHFFSSCVWMLCWVNLDLDSNVFPHIAQTFSDIVLTWQRLEQNWRYMCQKK